MTTKDFKRLVRERMAKTGESYSIARMHLRRGAPTPPTTSPTGTVPPLPTWTHEWLFDGKDIGDEIQTSLYDDLVDQVHSGEYPVGYTEFEELIFKDVNAEAGTAAFHVTFTAEHPSEDFDFNGYVEGELAFDVESDDDEDELDDQYKKDAFLDSLRVVRAEVRFDMGDPD